MRMECMKPEVYGNPFDFCFMPSCGSLFWRLVYLMVSKLHKHPSHMHVFKTDLNRNKVKANAGTQQQNSSGWHDRLPTRCRFTPTDFEDQVWAWLHSDCSLWLLRCVLCCSTTFCGHASLNQLWGAHCICRCLRLVRFMNVCSLFCFRM